MTCTCAPRRIRTFDLPLRRSCHGWKLPAAAVARRGLVGLWVPLDVCCFCFVRAREGHGATFGSCGSLYSLWGVSDSSRPGLWRPRYWVYGPITDERPADRYKIAELIQRGRAVTDERLLAQALAYARFRTRFCGGLGLFFLVAASGEVAGAAFGSSTFDRIVYGGLGGVFLLWTITWLWQADRSRRGARATVQACRQTVLAEVARMLRCLIERSGHR